MVHNQGAQLLHYGTSIKL